MFPFVRLLCGYSAAFILGCFAPITANANAVVLGDGSKVVLKAIRAAEAGDERSFKAQLSRHMLGSAEMKLIDLRPWCLLQSVVQESPIAVTAKWTCRAGKVDAVATRGFLLNRGRIAAITGEPIPAYRLKVQ